MKLISKQTQSGAEYSIELTAVEYGCIRLEVFEVKGGVFRYAVLDQVTALSLARLIEEMVRDIRRK
ncbi:MAG: hypothetical protein DDT32_02016 [Syntrophomonadaceae bacterium]|nr:hypothetical protein [Bacillota bacterium]